MAKKKKYFDGFGSASTEAAKENADFELEDLESFGELEPAEEAEQKPEEKEEPKGKLLVTSLRTWIYSEPDIFSKPVSGAQRGNQLKLLSGPMNSDDGKQWYKVEKPTVGIGYIELVRVKVM